MSRRLSALAFATLFGVALRADRFGDIELTPLVHSSIQIEYAGKVIQVDPWSRADLSKAKKADLILITDDPIHHLDPKAIAQARRAHRDSAWGPHGGKLERDEAGARRHSAREW
jgi:L-ascorbate metabolism protein UlaG (beta-lactamase superfamily)